MERSEVIASLRALGNYDTQKEKQKHLNSFDIFERSFEQNVESVTLKPLTPTSSSAGIAGYIQNEIIQYSTVVGRFYSELKSSLLVMDSPDVRHFAKNTTGIQTGDSNILEKAGDIFENISDLF